MKILMLMLIDVDNDYENVDVGSDVVWMLLVMLKMMLFRC